MNNKFGEFDSYEEINRAAKAQLDEGDLDAVKVIAEENGLDLEDAEDFCTGAIDELTTPIMAAYGKLEVEAKELHITGLMSDWKEQIFQLCSEDQDICLAVRKKGKNLESCLGELLKFSFEMKKIVPEKIVKAAGLRTPIYLGVPGRAEAKKIIKNYYLGGDGK